MFRLILHQCAISFIRPESWDLLDLFTLYRDFGQFPFPGTVLEQPAPMIDAFKIFQVRTCRPPWTRSAANRHGARRYPGRGVWSRRNEKVLFWAATGEGNGVLVESG